MKYHSLSSIADISTGIYKKAAPQGRVLYLQAKHFDEQGRIKPEEPPIPELLPDKQVDKHLLQDRDLLLIAKGHHNQACLYHVEWGPAVGSSVFFVIRLQSKEILPEYLQWYFNSRHIQLKLAGQYKGTSIPSISKDVLTEMEIPVPPLLVQEKILAVHRLWQRERSLMLQLLEEKALFYESALIKLTMNN